MRLRSVSLATVFCFLLSCLLTGCASKEQASKTTISVWHWMTDREPAFLELAKKYEAETGVRVDFELYAPSDAYTQKVRAAAQGVNLPDIFGILGEKRDFASFIKAGHILDLTANMEAEESAWKNYFFAKALAVNEFSEGNTYGIQAGIYGVPIDVTTIMMLYNKKLFKELGLNPNKAPTTFEEFLEIGKKIKGSDKQSFVSGWAELWMIDCFANNYAFNIMGKDKVLATLKGEVPYTDPDWIKVLGIFSQMRDAGLLNKAIVTMINKTAEQLFANEESIFAFNGSWCVNVYKGMNPDLEYAAMLPPRVSNDLPMSIWGGAGSSFMVNARSKNKEAAIEFLKWLTGKEQQAFLSQKTNNLPANKNSLSNIPSILAQFSKAMDNATHPNVWGVSEFSAVIEAWDKGIQRIILGESTPEKVAAAVQQVKERELLKRRN